MGIPESPIQHRACVSASWGNPAEEEETISIMKRAAEPVPDAFGKKSSRLVVALGEKHKMLDTVYRVSGGKDARETMQTFEPETETILPH